MKRIHILFLFIMLGLSVSSCDTFLDINENPNAPITENLPLSAKLPAALVATVNQETVQLNEIGAFWGGYWGTTSEGVNLFPDLKSYNGPAIRHQRDGIRVWETSYIMLNQYQLIREQATNEGAKFYEGVAKIMQGWHFMRLVDLYNNIPFEEALQGTRFPTPAYENGETVYQKSIKLITEGIIDIKQATPGSIPTTPDVLFRGNRSLWAKFGNTIKLRALIRQSETRNDAFIRSELEVIKNEGSGFLGVGQSALVQPGYLLTAGKLNPFWETYYRNVQGVSTANHIDIRPTEYIISVYQNLSDPRIHQLYTPVGDTHSGVLFGNRNAENRFSRANTSSFRGPVENSDKPAGLFKSPTQASVLLAAFESLFLQAEAAQRGWIDASAALLYERAIGESFSYLGVPSAILGTYLTQEAVRFNQSVEQIIQQKWLALNSISSIEAWNDFRRLGLPSIPNSLDAPSPTARPLRLMYPETERQTNNINTSQQGNDDILSTKVWWDVE
jgi:hypothetical protein